MAEPTDAAPEMVTAPAGVPNPLLLIAELTYRCPLHCPYCSNPTDIGDAKYQDELPAEDWQRVFREASELGVLQLALTGGEPMARKEIVDLVTTSTESGLYSTLVTSAMPFPRRAGGSAARGRPRPRADQLPALRPGAGRRDRRDDRLRPQGEGGGSSRASSTSR